MLNKIARILVKYQTPFNYKGTRYGLLAFINAAILEKLGRAILWDADNKLYYLD